MHFHYSQLSLPVFWCSTFFGTTYDSHGCKSLWNSAFLLFLLFLSFLLLVPVCVFSCVFLLDDESLRFCHCRRQCRRHKGWFYRFGPQFRLAFLRMMHFHAKCVCWGSTFFRATYIHVAANLCETLPLFLFFLLFLLFLFESCFSLCVFSVLLLTWWWRIFEVLPLQKAVQETQRLILQVWTPVPTSIPQDKAIKRNQGCLLVIAFVGGWHHKWFLDPLNTLR